MSTQQDSRVKEVIVDSRINKVLAMRTDSAAMLESLDSISQFYHVNTADARKALRQDLEMQNINWAKKFFDEFDKVREVIEGVDEHASEMDAACKMLASRVSEADENMKAFMEKAMELETKQKFYSSQATEIAGFLSKYQLSEEELGTLYRAPIEQGHSFFAALERLRNAYSDCREMVEKHKYSAGFEMLDMLGQHQDMAYQRLFEWLKNKCETLTAEVSSEDVDAMLQITIRYLKNIPAYYSQCQDLVVQSRRTLLVQRFVISLTQGGPMGSAYRAIDLHAHDSVRYIGDMLAWMHQAIASEEEFQEALFGSGGGNKRKGRGRRGGKGEGGGDGEEQEAEIPGDEKEGDKNGLSVAELLARSLQGLGRPLRVRVMQSLEAQPDLQTMYTLTDLLCFYEKTFVDIVPIENSVHSAVKGSLLECKRLFHNALSRQADKLTKETSSYPMDLSASHSTRSCAKQVQAILKVRTSALSNLPSDPADSCHVDTVLGSIIEPALHACRIAGRPLQGTDMAVYMLNNVTALQTAMGEIVKDTRLSPTQWSTNLATEAATWVEVLTKEETNRTLRRSDLDKLLELVDVLPSDLVASVEQGLSQDRIATAMRAFYASLFANNTPHFERLSDPVLREQTRQQTAEAVADAHVRMCRLITNPHNQYDTSILAHSDNEVRMLLGCQ
jgi:hypothetical protein